MWQVNATLKQDVASKRLLMMMISGVMDNRTIQSVCEF